MKYTIVFNNGNEVEITEAHMKALYDNIMKGAAKFQFFTEGNTDKILLVINLNEVAYIK